MKHTLLLSSLIKSSAEAPSFSTYLDSPKYFGRPGSAIRSKMLLTAAQQAGIDPRLFASIVANESGWGTNSQARAANNFSGSMGAGNKLFTYATPQEGLNAAAANLQKRYVSKGLTNPAQIGPVYAPTAKATNDPRGINKSWIPTVQSIYNRIPAHKPAPAAGSMPASAAPAPKLVRGTPPPDATIVNPVLAKGAPSVYDTVVP